MCLLQRSSPTPLSSTHVDVIEHVDEVAAPEIGRRQGRHVHLLVEPLLALAGPDLAPGHAGELAGLAGQHLAAAQVLDGLGERGLGRLHRHLAAVAHRRRDADALAGHVAAPVQAHPAEDRAARDARDAHVLLDLQARRLLLMIANESVHEKLGFGMLVGDLMDFRKMMNIQNCHYYKDRIRQSQRKSMVLSLSSVSLNILFLNNDSKKGRFLNFVKIFSCLLLLSRLITIVTLIRL